MVEDEKIIELYWNRDENAVYETSEKYGKYLFAIAYKILSDEEDSEESVNDTYLGAWNAIPPQKPKILSAFLGRITRNISLKKYRDKRTQKRGFGEVDLVYEEMEETISSKCSLFDDIEIKELSKTINSFLYSIPVTERRIFICRYWYLDSIEDICKNFGFGKSKIKSMLFRTRKKLLSFLEKEGVL